MLDMKLPLLELVTSEDPTFAGETLAGNVAAVGRFWTLGTDAWEEELMMFRTVWEKSSFLMQNDASCLIKLAFFFAESGEMGGLHWAFDNEIGSEIKSQSAKWNDNNKGYRTCSFFGSILFNEVRFYVNDWHETRK